MPSPISDAMILNLIDALYEGRLRISSSGSVYRTPDVSLIHRNTLHVTAPSFHCSLSAAGGVLLQVQGKAETPAVNANLFGEMGVWIQVRSNGFWMEIYVPTLTTRQLQLRSQPMGR